MATSTAFFPCIISRSWRNLMSLTWIPIMFLVHTLCVVYSWLVCYAILNDICTVIFFAWTDRVIKIVNQVSAQSKIILHFRYQKFLFKRLSFMCGSFFSLWNAQATGTSSPRLLWIYHFQFIVENEKSQ